MFEEIKLLLLLLLLLTCGYFYVNAFTQTQVFLISPGNLIFYGVHVYLLQVGMVEVESVKES